MRMTPIKSWTAIVEVEGGAELMKQLEAVRQEIYSKDHELQILPGQIIYRLSLYSRPGPVLLSSRCILSL